MNATSERMEFFFQWQLEFRQNICGLIPSWTQELCEPGLLQVNSLGH